MGNPNADIKTFMKPLTKKVDFTKKIQNANPNIKHIQYVGALGQGEFKHLILIGDPTKKNSQKAGYFNDFGARETRPYYAEIVQYEAPPPPPRAEATRANPPEEGEDGLAEIMTDVLFEIRGLRAALVEQNDQLSNIPDQMGTVVEALRSFANNFDKSVDRQLDVGALIADEIKKSLATTAKPHTQTKPATPSEDKAPTPPQLHGTAKTATQVIRRPAIDINTLDKKIVGATSIPNVVRSRLRALAHHPSVATITVADSAGSLPHGTNPGTIRITGLNPDSTGFKAVVFSENLGYNVTVEAVGNRLTTEVLASLVKGEEK